MRRPNLPGGGPDLNDLARRLSDRGRQFFSGPGGRGLNRRSVGLVAAGLGLLWLASGTYAVQTNEEAVVTQFGAYSRTTGPGLGYHLPWPFERVQRVPVTTLQRSDVGGGEGADRPDESMMITADENIVDLDFTIQWRINDAAKYLFNVADQEATIKMVAESAMREVVGRTALDPIISTGRGQVQQQALNLMQSILDQYDTGVQVVEVQIRNANPPRDVIAAFREVASASQDAESAINEANAYRNRVVNEAKGDAARIRQASEGYRERVTREAEGQAARFNQVYAEYRQAPGVTRDRLYLETMERVLRNSNKVIVDGNGTTAPVILPPDLFRNRQGEATASTPPVSAGQTAPTAPTQSAGTAR
jgi:membrane protease subunit HflK